MDQIAELPGGQARLYGGNLDSFEELRAGGQAAAQRAVSAAAAEVRRQCRDLADSQVKLARRERYGKKMYASEREPRIVMQARKRQAQGVRGPAAQPARGTARSGPGPAGRSRVGGRRRRGDPGGTAGHRGPGGPDHAHDDRPDWDGLAPRPGQKQRQSRTSGHRASADRGHPASPDRAIQDRAS